ncbi:MAG: sulfatase-like hydrolase/transferase [Planctomycetes bacterium]|nr:sulfatase-like hydrolase/transferase [Planctomycetota bacterium]
MFLGRLSDEVDMTWGLRLGVVLIVAKIATLWPHDIDLSAVMLVTLFAQDLATALSFGIISAITPWRWLTVTLYVGLAAHATLNTAIALSTGSPITPAMFGAAGGALGDSVAHFVRPRILGPTGLVAIVSVAASVLGRRSRQERVRCSARWTSVGVAVGLASIAGAGLWLEPRVDTHGLHRSATWTLIRGLRSPLPTGVPSIARRGDTEQALLPECEALHGAAASRNVLLVILESVCALELDRVDGESPMPFLDALSRRSIDASCGYTLYPESIKGLLPAFASRAPRMRSEAEDYAFEFPTLASHFAALGYRTSLYHSGRFDYLGMRSIIEDRGFARLIDAGDVTGVRDSSFGVDEETMVDRLLSDLGGLAPDERFFTIYMPIAGHHPYASPPGGPFRGDGEHSDYLNAIRYADRSIERLVTGLEQRGVLDDTLLVIVGDHGQAFGRHPGNTGHVFFLYDENLRVPLMIHASGITDRSEPRIWTQPISVIDLAPTILDLTGSPPWPGMEGHSLLREPRSRPVHFFTDYSLPLVGIREDQWKLIHDLESGRDELFDLSHDPDERDNLATRHPDVTARLRGAAIEWLSPDCAPVTEQR